MIATCRLAAILAAECEGPLSKHGHQTPGKSGRTGFHPTAPFLGRPGKVSLGAQAASPISAWERPQ